MDIVTYALSKKYADSIASDITNITTDGNEIYFTTSGGTTFTVTLNSVASLNVSASGHLIVTLTNGDTIDAGALPVGTMDTALSTTSENGVQNKVITAALGTKQNALTAGTAITIDNTDPAAPVISANNDYTNLVNKPTALSAFTNDQGFIDNTVNNLTNYYLKTATYSAAEIDTLISNLHSLTVEIVETLPESDISTHTIYLVNITGTNNYNQWMYINNAWSNIGSTSVDLTNYYTKAQTDTLLDGKVDKVTGYGLSQENFTSAYKAQLDNYTVDTILDSTSSNPIANSAVTNGLDAKQNKTLATSLVIDGQTTTTVEAALGNLNTYANKKLTITSTIPVSPSNGDVILYTGTSTADYKQGGVYQYQVSEWVLITTDSDTIIKRNYSMAGTASLEDDIKTFVAALIASGANTYAGYFNRSGSLGTAGNYCITVYAEEGSSTFASGYIVLGAGALGKVQYTVSYYKPTGSSGEWTIKKLAAASDTVIRHDYGITGTVDAVEDTKTLVNHILTLDAGTYAGEFKRTGITFGSYRLTYFIDGDSSVSVSGTVTYSISNSNDATYQISYVLSNGSSTPYWNIEKLVVDRENNFKYQVIATDSDLNNIKLSGAYSLYITDATAQAAAHAPAYGWVQLVVVQMNNSDAYCQQIAYYSGDGIFMRECSYNVWSAWKRVVVNTVLSGTYTIPAQTLANGAYAELEIPLVPGEFYCGRIDFGSLPSVNMSLSYNDFSGTFQDTRSTDLRTQYVLYPIGKANLATLHVYLTNYTGSPVTISDIPVNYYLEHHKS